MLRTDTMAGAGRDDRVARLDPGPRFIRRQFPQRRRAGGGLSVEDLLCLRMTEAATAYLRELTVTVEVRHYKLQDTANPS